MAVDTNAMVPLSPPSVCHHVQPTTLFPPFPVALPFAPTLCLCTTLFLCRTGPHISRLSFPTSPGCVSPTSPSCMPPTMSFLQKGCSHVPSLAHGPPLFHPPSQFAPPTGARPTAPFVQKGHSHATPFSCGPSPHWNAALCLPHPFSPLHSSPPFGKHRAPIDTCAPFSVPTVSTCKFFMY